MKKLVFLMLLFLGFFISLMAQTTFPTLDQAREAYVLGLINYYIPVDTTGFKPLAKGERLVKITKDKIFQAQIVGGKRFAIFEKGTFVVIDKNDRVLRVWKCANTVYGVWDVPKKENEGKYIPLSMLSQVQIPGPPGPKGDRGERGYKGDKGDSFIQESNWSAGIIVPSLFGLAGGLIGGFGFPKENEVITETITPGVKVQTGNGTFIYGPQKIKTDIRVEKSFNWTGAAIGFGSGIILGYLLNEVVF